MPFPLTLQHPVGFLPVPCAAPGTAHRLWDPRSPNARSVGNAGWGKGKGAGEGCPPESPCGTERAVNSCWLGSCGSIIHPRDELMAQARGLSV